VRRNAGGDRGAANLVAGFSAKELGERERNDSFAIQ